VIRTFLPGRDVDVDTELLTPGQIGSLMSCADIIGAAHGAGISGRR